MKYVISPFRILLVFLWTAICATIAFLIYIFTFSSDRVLMIVPGKMWAPVVYWLNRTKFVVEGRENIDYNNYYIYVGNHTSQMDIPATVMAIDVPLYFMLKQELKKIPFLGWYATMLGMIYVDRKNKQKAQKSIERAGELIKKGKNVLVYPEGTRSPDGSVKLFRKGAFKISKAAEIGIVPFGISGTEHVLGKGAFHLEPGKTVRVKIGRPIQFQEIQHLDEIELAEHLRQKVIELRD